MKIASLFLMAPLYWKEGTSTIIATLKTKTLNSKSPGLWKTLRSHPLQRDPNLLFSKITWATQQKHRFTGSAQQPQDAAQEHVFLTSSPRNFFLITWLTEFVNCHLGITERSSLSQVLERLWHLPTMDHIHDNGFLIMKLENSYHLATS